MSREIVLYTGKLWVVSVVLAGMLTSCSFEDATGRFEGPSNVSESESPPPNSPTDYQYKPACSVVEFEPFEELNPG